MLKKFVAAVSACAVIAASALVPTSASANPTYMVICDGVDGEWQICWLYILVDGRWEAYDFPV